MKNKNCLPSVKATPLTSRMIRPGTRCFAIAASVVVLLLSACLARSQTPPAAAPAKAGPALVAATFEGREWQMGVNATVSTDEGTPVISVKGGQGGRPAGGARPIGHVAIAQGISLKEGAIEFEMKSAQLNPVGHNYIGAIFRVQDQLRYEAIYWRFCPGQLAGIQFASVSDGTDPWQQFQDPKYTRHGVFADKTWIKIRLELRGERLLVFMNGEPKPTLDVDRLPGGYGAGSVGFWAFPTSGEGMFRNLRVTPGPLPGPEPPKGELAVLPTPPDDTASAPAAQPARRNQRGQRAQTPATSSKMAPPSQPGTLDRTQWANRLMQGAKWVTSDLDAGAVTNGVLQAAGSADVQRRQIIYKAAQLTGDFDLTAQYQGTGRVGLVCADGQRGYIGIQNPVSARSDLRIRRTGKQIEFTLNGQPVTYTKALTSEDAPFYFGAILDNGMQCEVSGFKLAAPARP